MPHAGLLRVLLRRLAPQPLLHRSKVDDLAHPGILPAAQCINNRRDIMGSTLTLKAADGFSLSAYTAGSASAKAGLVVVQEILGVNHPCAT
jgi:hypothetical protein